MSANLDVDPRHLWNLSGMEIKILSGVKGGVFNDDGYSWLLLGSPDRRGYNMAFADCSNSSSDTLAKYLARIRNSQAPYAEVHYKGSLDDLRISDLVHQYHLQLEDEDMQMIRCPGLEMKTPILPGLDIFQAQDRRAMIQAIRVMAGGDQGVAEDGMRVFREGVFEDPRVAVFLASYQEKVVSTVMTVSPIPNMMAFWNVVTLEGFRGNGFAPATLRHAMVGAQRERRLNFFHLCCSNSKARGVYKRLGFLPVDTANYYSFDQSRV